MENWLQSPIVIMVILAVAGALLKIGKWWGDVNSDRAALKDSVRENSAAVLNLANKIRDDVREIRQDIKEIFKRLPPPTVTPGSPITLTPLGEKVASEIGAREWARKEAPRISERVAGKSKYEIQELCMDYCTGEYQAPLELMDQMQNSAYRNGIGLRAVKEVLGVLLRDEIIPPASG